MKVKIFHDGLEGFVRRSNDRAAKRVRGEHIASEKVITFADAADMMACLTAQRVRLFQTAKIKPLSISALAQELGRTRAAVTKDVNKLQGYGLITLREQVNPGHGRVQIVCPVAQRVDMHVAL